MGIRIGLSFAFSVLALLLVTCAVIAYRSHKAIGKAVCSFCIAIIAPIIGHLIIIGSSYEDVSMVGYYFYFMGMDLIMIAFVSFTNQYCQGIGDGTQKPTVVYVILCADLVQMALNTVFGHAFKIEAIDVQGMPYYRVVPFWGQTIHRIIDYGSLACIMLMFILASVKTVKIYRERYLVILFSTIGACLWQTFYIFSRTPIDISMIGIGCMGLIVFYFSIKYRPLRLLDRMLSVIAANMSDALYVYDPEGKCIWANEHGLKFAGVDGKEYEKVSPGIKKIFGERPYSTLDWTDNRVIGYGENAKYYNIENHSVSDEEKHLAGSFLIIRDNTEEQKRLMKEFYNSTHDSLTDLFTKQYLYECIRKTIEANEDMAFAAIFVDVKNFKIVNDVFGADFGDKALQQVGDWVRKDMTEKCVYGRLAGDTFGIFVPMQKFEDDKDMIEQELINFVVSDENIEHHLLIHLGVYEVTEKNIDVSVMFDRAHLALSTINDDYKTHIAYYDNKLRDKVLWDQKITAALRDAINTMQIRPYLQPITDRSGKVVGAEALARWIHPERGFMPPAMFIPVFEKNGMIVEVDKHMWRCACGILSDWKGKHDDMFVSINISPKDFYFFDVASEIRALVKEYGIEPSKLRIEITETVMMSDSDEKMRIFEELRRSGFIVEMDDFGSGYSSLNLLKDMPVDVLKLDMKFLSSSEDDKKAQTIIGNIIRLSEELNIDSLTEGVETKQQFDDLYRMGCKLFQGYYFSKPIPVEEFEQYAFGNPTA